MKSFFAVLQKEILTFLRNIGLVIFVLYSFTLDIYTAGEGIKIKPQYVTIGYVNNMQGEYFCNKILTHFHLPEFKTPKRFLNEKALKEAIFNKEILVGMIFDKNKKLNILLDATAASQSEVTLIYISEILNTKKFDINIKIHKLFNQNSNSTWFMSLTEMMSIVTMLSLILVAVVFVKEKEQGTWDIMLLMPVNGSLIILGKVLSQVLIIMIGVYLSVGLVIFGVFDTPINGSLFLFFLLTFLFSLSLGGIALVIASFSNSVMQVAQISMLIMLPLLFLSGAWTPINSMAWFLQKLSFISPVRYYIEGVESIFFRGADFYDLIPYFGGEIIIGIILFYIGFRKIGRLF